MTATPSTLSGAEFYDTPPLTRMPIRRIGSGGSGIGYPATVPNTVSEWHHTHEWPTRMRIQRIESGGNFGFPLPMAAIVSQWHHSHDLTRVNPWKFIDRFAPAYQQPAANEFPITFVSQWQGDLTRNWSVKHNRKISWDPLPIEPTQYPTTIIPSFVGQWIGDLRLEPVKRTWKFSLSPASQYGFIVPPILVSYSRTTVAAAQSSITAVTPTEDA